MRILIVAKVDCAGSGQRFANALRSAGHDALMVVTRRSGYHFPLDLLVDNNTDLQRLVDRADVVHLKGDHLPSDYHGIRMDHKPIVITAGGSGFRRRSGFRRERIAQEWHPLWRYARHTLGVLTPDLMYPAVDAIWTPHAAEPWHRWKAPGDAIVIGHSPSGRNSKGTDTVVVPAVQYLQDLGYPVVLYLMEGMTNLRCLQAKTHCHLFFDQAVIPAYGMSGVEAMAMGVPVIQYLSPEVRRRHAALGKHCPVIAFAEPTPTAAAEAIRAVLDQDQLAALSRRTLNYARRVHGHRAVAATLVQLYRAAIRRRNARNRRAA